MTTYQLAQSGLFSGGNPSLISGVHIGLKLRLTPGPRGARVVHRGRVVARWILRNHPTLTSPEHVTRTAPEEPLFHLRLHLLLGGRVSIVFARLRAIPSIGNQTHLS